MMKSLELIMYERKSDKYEHDYCGAYEQHFNPLRSEPIELLEIGVLKGSSLFGWADYFEKGHITGVDIDPMLEVNVERITTIVQDIKEYEPDREFDIIIDDGSHHSDDILAAYERLWDSVRSGGYYVIEDLAAQYLVPSHGYGGDVTGSPASEFLREIMHRVLTGETTKFSEFHAHGELLFLRKAA